jgi:hypothetical protein
MSMTEVRTRDRQLLALMRLLARPGSIAQAQGSVIRIGGRRSELPARLLDESLARGLGVRQGAGVVICPAGLAWLKRALSEAGDPFRAQHQERRLAPADPAKPGGQTLTVDDAESPLAWLRRRKDKSGGAMISDAQFEAGERLRGDFLFAQMTPRTTMSWSATAMPTGRQRSAAGLGVELRDNVIAAKERVGRALRAVGPELADVLIDVCCHLKGLEESEGARGWPQRSGKVVLQLALTRLARHYGILAPDNPRTGEGLGTIQHWGAEGYRPDAGKW